MNLKSNCSCWPIVNRNNNQLGWYALSHGLVLEDEPDWRFCPCCGAELIREVAKKNPVELVDADCEQTVDY